MKTPPLHPSERPEPPSVEPSRTHADLLPPGLLHSTTLARPHPAEEDERLPRDGTT
jgi:hypothetical protein